MLTALLTTLGILLGILIFFVVIGVGVVEIIRAIGSSIARNRKDKKRKEEI